MTCFSTNPIDFKTGIWYNIGVVRNKEKKMDIRKHRFVPNFSTATRVIVDKKCKQKSRKFLNNPKNWR